MPLLAVAIRLEGAYELVPEGHEADGLGLDAELARLLHGAAADTRPLGRSVPPGRGATWLVGSVL